MALQRLRNDPEAGWELRKRTPLWGPDFLINDESSVPLLCGDEGADVCQMGRDFSVWNERQTRSWNRARPFQRASKQRGRPFAKAGFWNTPEAPEH